MTEFKMPTKEEVAEHILKIYTETEELAKESEREGRDKEAIKLRRTSARAKRLLEKCGIPIPS